MSIGDRTTVFVGLPSLQDLAGDLDTTGTSEQCHSSNVNRDAEAIPSFHFESPLLSSETRMMSYKDMSKWRPLHTVSLCNEHSPAGTVSEHRQDHVQADRGEEAGLMKSRISCNTDFRVEELVYLEDLPTVDQFSVLKQTLVSLLVVITHISKPRFIPSKIGQELSEIVVLQVVDQTCHETPFEITLWEMRDQLAQLKVCALDVVFLTHVTIRSYRGTITGNMNGNSGRIQRLHKPSILTSSKEGVDQQARRLRDIYQWLPKFFDSQIQDSFKSTAEV